MAHKVDLGMRCYAPTDCGKGESSLFPKDIERDIVCVCVWEEKMMKRKRYIYVMMRQLIVMNTSFMRVWQWHVSMASRGGLEGGYLSTYSPRYLG